MVSHWALCCDGRVYELIRDRDSLKEKAETHRISITNEMEWRASHQSYKSKMLQRWTVWSDKEIERCGKSSTPDTYMLFFCFSSSVSLFLSTC